MCMCMYMYIYIHIKQKGYWRAAPHLSQDGNSVSTSEPAPHTGPPVLPKLPSASRRKTTKNIAKCKPAFSRSGLHSGLQAIGCILLSKLWYVPETACEQVNVKTITCLKQPSTEDLARRAMLFTAPPGMGLASKNPQPLSSSPFPACQPRRGP